MEKKVGGRYRIGKKIGKGSFGEIYLGTNTETGELFALKIEKVDSKHPQLQYESRIYRILQGCPGIPNMHWYGSESNLNIMVLDLLGPSLEELSQLCKGKISLKSVLMLSGQLITRLEDIHSKNFLHRDVKPNNFLIGTGQNASTVFAIDFGLAKKYIDRNTNLHIPYREGKKLTGTARYASIYTHLGCEQSRRDDFECLGYLIVYLLKGFLPWEGLSGQNKEEKYKKILEKKIATSVEELCENIPEEIKVYINYIRALRFEEKPDYMYLKHLFNQIFEREGYTLDFIYDWTRVHTPRDSFNIEEINQSNYRKVNLKKLKNNEEKEPIS